MGNIFKKELVSKERSKYERRSKLKYLIGSIGMTTEEDF
jgi:hypothetical protein